MSTYCPDRYSDSTVEQVTDLAREISPYESGDVVTVEPTDYGSSYDGSWLEGCKLTVDEFRAPRAHSLKQHRVDRWLNHPDNTTDQVVETDQTLGGKRVNIAVKGGIWTFCEVDRSVDRTDAALVSWDEYYEHGEKIRRAVDTRSTDGTEWDYIRDTAATDEVDTTTCPTCESTWIRVRGRRDVESWERQACATCGETIAEHSTL